MFWCIVAMRVCFVRVAAALGSLVGFIAAREPGKAQFGLQVLECFH